MEPDREVEGKSGRLKQGLVIAIGLGFLLSGYAAFAGQGPLIKSYDVEMSVYNACNKAREQLEAGSFDKARDILTAAAANDPTSYSSTVHAYLARSYKGNKDFAKAAEEAQAALTFDPQNQQAMYLLATTCSETGQYDRAVKLLKALEKMTSDPDFAEQVKKTAREITVYKSVKQAERSLQSNNYAEARPFLEQAAALDPTDFSGPVHCNLAFVLERTGQPEKAIAEANKSLSFNAKDKTTLYCLGIAYQDIGKFDEAISWLRKYAAVETEAEKRAKANTLIEELADDKIKLDPAANAKPDYLQQLQAKDAVHAWPKEMMPLKVYISNKNVNGYRPIFKEFIIRALNTWCDVSAKKLSYKLVDDKKSADMIVSWTHDPLPMEESGRQRQKAGLTNTNLDENSHQITDARVRIRTVNGFEPNKLITDGEAASVSMHEIGHAMGLGHSTCCSDIMYFGSSSKQTGFPSKRDKATIAALYKDYPVMAFVGPKATIPTDTKIKYLPPPAFQVPVPSNMEKLPPPLFMPPPAKAINEKLSAPVFVPPPLKKSGATRPVAPPTFLPPPK